jgi:mRNA interferase MazF
MNRGEIWTIAGGSHYAGKPRPVLILQNDRFTGTESVTVCPLTSVNIDGHLFRVPVFPDDKNRLRSPSWLMADKVFTVPRTKLGTLIGRIDDATLTEIIHAITVFLDLIPGRPRHRRVRTPTRRR